MSARAIMVLGTASHVGKSVIAAAICRILADDGYSVAPFKAQNMSLNSAATPDGREIGRAQAMQAEAARVVPTVEMNPILLKPTSQSVSQVVLLGRVHAQERAADYHQRRVAEYFPVVVDAYRRLAERHDVIVIEGAGSPAEINLKATDIVNMRVAQAADARCLLVADIDRGGVFAALMGTVALLDPDERTRVRAFAINKFRGDLSLLAPGIAEIERRIDVPCAGVVPWLADMGLDEEDGVALEDAPRVTGRGWRARNGDRGRALRVAVVALPYIAHATDFAALAAEPSVDLAYADAAEDLLAADVVIVPGTKETLGALRWLRSNGMAEAVRSFATRGLVFGICGGFQILGRSVADPHGVEGGGALDGLGILPVETVLEREKITELVHVRPHRSAFFGIENGSHRGTGYEIHMGRSSSEGMRAFAELERKDGGLCSDGALSEDRRVVGTYVHGLFADDEMRHAFVQAAREASGLDKAKRMVRYAADRDARFDRLAAHVRGALDLTGLLP